MASITSTVWSAWRPSRPDGAGRAQRSRIRWGKGRPTQTCCNQGRLDGADPTTCLCRPCQRTGHRGPWTPTQFPRTAHQAKMSQPSASSTTTLNKPPSSLHRWMIQRSHVRLPGMVGALVGTFRRRARTDTCRDPDRAATARDVGGAVRPSTEGNIQRPHHPTCARTCVAWAHRHRDHSTLRQSRRGWA